MKLKSKIEGLVIIQPDIFYDYRGEYIETYNDKEYAFTDSAGKPVIFRQDDISVSGLHVLRGLHGDNKTWKLIQCLLGDILLAVIDLRKESPTYLVSETFSINDKNRRQVLVPAGCANGHLCLAEKNIFSYKQSEYYTGPENQFTIKWDDPFFNINWPVNNPVLSYRDKNASLFIK